MLPLDEIKCVPLRSTRRTPRPRAPGDLITKHKIEALDPSAADRTARAYDYVGDEYGRYADGVGVNELAAPDGRFSHADSIVWESIRSSLEELRKARLSTVRILDAGCGPGLWTRRIAKHAHGIGMGVEAVGFDISKAQLELARKQAAGVAARHCHEAAISLEFLEHDLTKPLPWADGQFHIVLCNYAVLNHLVERTLPLAIAELCRVASARVIATVRAVGSPVTACIVGTERVQSYWYDANRGQLALVLKDGSHHRLPFSVYPARMLETMFAPHADVVDLRAVDLFLNRFAPDENWTARLVSALPDRPTVVQQLKDLESSLCRLPGWVDHGTHILIVAQPKSASGGDCVAATTPATETPVATSFAEFLAGKSG